MTRGVLFALVCACVGTAVAAKRPDWVLYRINDRAADYRLESIDRSAFRLSATRRDAPGKTMALAIADVNRGTWTHDKIVFSVRSLDGRAARMNVAVSYADGAKTPMRNAPGVVVSGRNWTDQVLSLDNDFGLGDRAIQIRQVKISLNPTDFPVGASGGIEVAGFRVCGPNEARTSAAYREGDTFVAVPAQAPPPLRVRPDALKVFFAFDNEDVVPSRSRRKKGLLDEQQYGGFREILLERTDGAAVVTTNLDEAGAIVYASCRTNAALARLIAARVTGGGVRAAGGVDDRPGRRSTRRPPCWTRRLRRFSRVPSDAVRWRTCRRATASCRRIPAIRLRARAVTATRRSRCSAPSRRRTRGMSSSATTAGRMPSSRAAPARGASSIRPSDSARPSCRARRRAMRSSCGFWGT